MQTDEPLNVDIHIHMSEDMLRKLRALAQANDRTTGAEIRRALRFWLNGEERG